MTTPSPNPGPQRRNPNMDKLYGFLVAGFLLLVGGAIMKACGR